MDRVFLWENELVGVATVATAIFTALTFFGVVMMTNVMILLLMTLLFLVMWLVLERTKKVADLESQWTNFLARKEAQYAEHFTRMEERTEKLVNQYVEKTTEQDTRISKLESEWELFKRPKQPGS